MNGSYREVAETVSKVLSKFAHLSCESSTIVYLNPRPHPHLQCLSGCMYSYLVYRCRFLPTLSSHVEWLCFEPSNRLHVSRCMAVPSIYSIQNEWYGTCLSKNEMNGICLPMLQVSCRAIVASDSDTLESLSHRLIDDHRPSREINSNERFIVTRSRYLQQTP